MADSVLVFGWGNPSRGDDALGPLFVDAVEAMKLPGVECLTDFQLQVEHALDLLHSLDPPGIGARDLRECLMIQLEHIGLSARQGRSVEVAWKDGGK